MGAMASLITSLMSIYSIVYSGADQRNIKAPCHRTVCSPGTGKFPAQMASNAENVSIWWRHQAQTVYSINMHSCFLCFVLLWFYERFPMNSRHPFGHNPHVRVDSLVQRQMYDCQGQKYDCQGKSYHCQVPLQWRHNDRDGVSYHQPHDCLFNRLFSRRSKKKSKLRVTGLCAGNPTVTCEYPAQRASNAENVSIWWRHHDQGSIPEE